MGNGKNNKDISLIILIVLSFLALGGGVFYSGLWDPWETNDARAIKQILDHDSSFSLSTIKDLGIEVPPLKLWFLTSIFKVAGFSELAAKISLLVITILTLILSYFVIRRFANNKIASYTTIIMATVPLFFLTSVQFYTYIFPFLGYILAVGCFMIAYFKPPWQNKPLELLGRILFLLAGTVGVLIGILSYGGVLGGGLPVVSSLIGFLALTGLKEFKLNKIIVLVYLSIITIAIAIWTIPAIFNGVTDYSLALGAQPRAGNLTTFEYYLEYIAFATFPWVGFIPFGIAYSINQKENIKQLESNNINSEQLNEPINNESEIPWGMFCVILMVIGYLFFGLWATRYPQIPITFIWPIAVIISLTIKEAEENGFPNKMLTLVVLLLWLLILRDWLLYPDSILKVIDLNNIEYPAGIPVTIWIGFYSILFGISTYFLFWQGIKQPYIFSYKDEINLIISFFKGEKGKKSKIIAIIIVVVIGLVFINGIGSYFGENAVPWAYMAYFPRRLSYWFALSIPMIAIFYYGFKLVWNLFAKVEQWKVKILLLSAILGVVLINFGLWPQLTKNFSPRELISKYKQLNKSQAPLGVYHYQDEVLELFGIQKREKLATVNNLVSFFDSNERKFAIVPAKEIAPIDSAYSDKLKKHIVVADDSSKKLFLVSNIVGAGEKNLNPLLKFVRRTAPVPHFSIKANLDNKIEYLGYDIISERGKTVVGSSEKFKIRYYWHALTKIPGRWKVFVHIDGYGMRLNGDHEPLSELYTTEYWVAGDYIIDEQELRMPAHFVPGDYNIYLGFFQGSKRMHIIEGPKTQDDRIIGGILRVR